MQNGLPDTTCFFHTEEAILYLFRQNRRYIPSRQVLVAVHTVHQTVIAAKAVDLRIREEFKPLAEDISCRNRRDDMYPAHVRIDIGEHFAEHSQFQMVGVAGVKKVKAHTGVFKEDFV